MFDHLPLHIRETIFNHVRYVDLFETARVSQGWWALSLASFDRVLHAKDDFLLDQVDFCNEMMPEEEPWQWWMLMEFTKSKKLYVENDDFPAFIDGGGKGKLLQYFEDKEINVQDLRIRKNIDWFEDLLRLPPNLKQLFPDLRSLELSGVEFKDCSAVILPAKLEVVKLNCIQIPLRTSLNSMLSDPCKLKVLALTGYDSDVYFDGRNCRNLVRLYLYASNLSENEETDMNHILRRILNQNKGLKIVSLEAAEITKEWSRMFPSNVVKLELKHPHLSMDLIELFGKNVLYERMALIYLCEDWKSVVKFKTWEMRWDIQRVEDAADYRIKYVCKPTANLEEITVRYDSKNITLRNAILQSNQGLELTKLKYEVDNFLFSVPRTVRHLYYGWHCEHGKTLVHEDPSVIETLYLNPRHSSAINLDDLSNMTNLRKLDLRECDSRCLACILVSCSSLTELKLDSSARKVFERVESDIQSVSLRRLTILGGNDTLEDILKHLPSINALTLHGHSVTAILQSSVNAISHLQYFNLMVYKNKDVAIHLSSLMFPNMLFACSDSRDFYSASKGMELINEISVEASANNHINAERSFTLKTNNEKEKLSLVYSKNVATRFLRTSCLVVNKVQDFIIKY